MPITVFPPTPGGRVGWGAPVTVQESSIGPYPPGTLWSYNLFGTAVGVDPLFLATKPFTGVTETFTIGDPNESAYSSYFRDLTSAPLDGATVAHEVYLMEPSGGDYIHVDTISGSDTWSTTAWLSAWVTMQGSSGAALSPSQQSQLTTAADNSTSILAGVTATITSAAGAIEQTLGQIFSQHTLDTLTLTNLTPSGPVGTPVTSDLSDQLVFGVIIRIASFGPEFYTTTPDNDWSPLDYAVLTLFRGTDKTRRVAIHTSSHMEYHLP